MKARLIAKEDVFAIVDLLRAQGYDVFAPFRERVAGPAGIAAAAQNGADTHFSLVTDQNRNDVALHGRNPLYPPKRFVLPHIQRLMTMERVDGQVKVTPSYRTPYAPETPSAGDEDGAGPRRLAVFGMRSCDVAGIRHLDRFYLGGEYRDVYYERLRNGLFIVNVACTEPGEDIGPDCFCVCTDTGPAAREGFDLQLLDLGDRFMAVAGSPEGSSLLEAPVFRRGTPDDLVGRRRVLSEARRSFLSRTSWFSGAVRAVSEGIVPEATWEAIGNRCLECGGCTFVCPACTCFTVSDREAGPGLYERVRVWDSCALAGFTRMAGGFNPRKAVHDRRNRRFFRKLSHYFVQRELSVACVGCGRCAAVCHGDIGMPTVVEMIRRGVAESRENASSGG